MAETVTFEQHALAVLDRYSVPAETEAARVLVDLGRAQDGRLDPLDLIVVQRGFVEMIKAIEDAYASRSPLEEQRDYLRARRQYKELTGEDLPPWRSEW